MIDPDHDLLVQIDTKMDNIEQLLTVHDKNITDLRVWKNRMIGAMVILAPITGVGVVGF